MPKTITGGVGRGGRNFPASDVMTVQYLLNCVPASQGGPIPELAVDGVVGPKTIAAIEKFQRANGGACDGRVDAGGATLRALQARDPYPGQALAQGGGKSGGFGQPGNKDPFDKGGFGQPGNKDPFGKGGFGQPGNKDPFGKGGFGQPGNKDPFGKGGFGQPVNKDPFGKGGFGQPGNNDPFGGKGGFGQPGSKGPFGSKGF